MHLNKSNFKIYQQIFELQNCVEKQYLSLAIKWDIQ